MEKETERKLRGGQDLLKNVNPDLSPAATFNKKQSNPAN
jgi:hypothetical protein